MARGKWPVRVVPATDNPGNGSKVTFWQILGAWTVLSIPVSLAMGPIFGRRQPLVVSR